jgi:GT2 family glycosyltransferase
VLADHPLDEATVHGEDLDWLLRVRDAGLNVVLVDDHVFDYRLRADSLAHSDMEASRAALPRLLHESLKRNGRVGK